MTSSEKNYKDAVKNERQSNLKYTKKVDKRKTFKNLFDKSIDKYQKEKIEKVAIVNCAKEEYQKNVRAENCRFKE